MSNVVDKEPELGSHLEIHNLYNEYRKPLVSFFSRKLPKDEDPEDMTQQVFIKLVEAVDRTELIFSRNLIFVIARNALIDRLRWRKSHRVEKHDMVDESLIMNDEPLPDRVLEGKQRLGSFIEHLDNLPVRCRQVFLLHRVKNMSQKEVADYLGISLSTVHKHMMNAMTKIHENIRSIEDL